MMKAGKSQIYERRAVGGLSAAVWLIIQLQGCAEVPVTQRKGLHLVPETELLSMSIQQCDEVLKKSKLSTDTRKPEKPISNNICPKHCPILKKGQNRGGIQNGFK